jgi:hypothetical protein
MVVLGFAAMRRRNAKGNGRRSGGRRRSGGVGERYGEEE